MKAVVAVFVVVLLWVSSASAALPPPTTLRLSFANDQITAFWHAVNGASGYRLLYAPYPNAEFIGEVDLGDSTHLSLRLPLGAAFYVAVRPYNAEGVGWFSNIEAFEFTGDTVPVPSHWRLESFGPTGREQAVLPGTEITLSFEQPETGSNRVFGSSGCNYYGGDYFRGDNGLLKLGTLSSTLIACGEEVGTQESKYHSALEAVAAYVLEAQRLVLLSGDGLSRLNFVRVSDAE